MSWFSALGANCRPDAPLAPYTWYGLGGPARWLITPADESQLVKALAICKRERIPWRVLGKGANLLVRDAGFDGAVFLLNQPAFDDVRIDGPRVFAGAGADFTKLVNRCAKIGLAGLENLAGIPGSIGGIVRMNAGGKYGSIGRFVREARILEPDGEIRSRTVEQIGFSYRHTDLAGCIVLAAVLELESSSPDVTLPRFRDIWNEKAASQPAVSERSCGCIFKNPAGHAAGALVDRAGLKGKTIGGAEISTRHANFIVARNGATAADVLELIALAQQRVRQEAGVQLETEVEIW